MTNPDNILKNRDITLQTKVHVVKAMFFLVVMHRCDDWTIKNAEHQRIDAFKLWCWKRLLDSKEIKPVNPQVYQPWIFIGRTDVEVEVPVFWPSNGKRWIIGKDSDAGKDWRQEKKVMTEDERIGQHHWFSGHEFEQTLGDSEEPGSLVCCRSWGHKETGTTKWLNNNILRGKYFSKKCCYSFRISRNIY